MNPHLSQDWTAVSHSATGLPAKSNLKHRQFTWNQPEALKQYVSYWEVLEVRMYTPVLFAAQMELGLMRGITTCPSMNPYLQKKYQQLHTCKAVMSMSSYPIEWHVMQCNASFNSPQGVLEVLTAELYEILK